MNVKVLFFSVLRDLTGAEEVLWPVAADARVADLLQSLYGRWPGLAEWDGSLLVAVDQVYVKRDAPVQQGCEVAIMPPVQGG